MSEFESSASDGSDLPPPSIPAGLNIAVRDFTNEEAAREFGNAVYAVIQALSRMMDLSRLDGVTIGIDYDAALASVDRGMPGLRPLSRSDTTEMQGVAMSPAVIRDGEARTHLVFNAEQLVPLYWKGDEVTDDDRAFAIGIIAHECAHVQVTADKERAIPDCRLGTPIEGYEHAIMFQIAEICWDEYAVCRMSAPFAQGQNESHALTVAACAEVARNRANEAIKSYRLHGDLDRLVAEAGAPLCAPIKAVAYLLGGIDGVEAGWDDHPEARVAIEAAGYGDLVDDLHAELRHLWDTYDSWLPTLDTFAGLEAIARSTFESNGIHFQTNDDGACSIDVPFTHETWPN